MKISISEAEKVAVKSDLLMFGIWHHSKPKTKAKGLLAQVDKNLGSVLLTHASQEGFSGDDGQVYTTSSLGQSEAQAVALFGLGDTKKQTVDLWRKFGGEAVNVAQKKRARKVIVVVPEDTTVPQFDVIQAIAEGAALANYRFDKYFTKEKKERYVSDLVVALPSAIAAHDKQAVARAHAITHGVCLARDVINEGPMELNPVKLAKVSSEAAKEFGLKVSVLDEKALQKERMNLMLAVANAASNFAPPRLICLHYKPKKATKKTIVLVGKGVTFDSGGLDIKTADGMLDMKYDMSGAAAVLGTMCAIAQLKPNVEVIGYMSCVENGIGSAAYHPSDIITSRKGTTVEINNTDAEGRLILADAMTYAQDQHKPDILIDIATLTGACMIALGSKTAGLFSKSDDLCDEIIMAGKMAGESFWRLPLDPDLRPLLKSSVADMRNTGERYGGAITAALFLEEFIEEKTTWAHLDIAGPAKVDKPWAYNPTGGAGFAVRTLTQFIMGQ